MVSETSKQMVMLEVTVPLEKTVEEANKRERPKVTHLMEECRVRWRVSHEGLKMGVDQKENTLGT